jgi:hypothetical protein
MCLKYGFCASSICDNQIGCLFLFQPLSLVYDVIQDSRGKLGGRDRLGVIRFGEFILYMW